MDKKYQSQKCSNKVKSTNETRRDSTGRGGAAPQPQKQQSAKSSRTIGTQQQVKKEKNESRQGTVIGTSQLSSKAKNGANNPLKQVNQLLRQGQNKSVQQNIKSNQILKQKNSQNQTVQADDFNKENISQGFFENKASNSNSQSINGIKYQPSQKQQRQNTKKVIQSKIKNQDPNIGELEGLSFSSFSSNDKRRVNNDRIQNHAKIKKTKSSWIGSIAEQLSKNYFLNSQQLLRHLSPERIFDSQNKNEATSGLLGPAQSNQKYARIQSGLSASSNQQRGRNRSSNATKSNKRGKAINFNENISFLLQRRTQSHSQSKKSQTKSATNQKNGFQKTLSQTKNEAGLTHIAPNIINSTHLQNNNYVSQLAGQYYDKQGGNMFQNNMKNNSQLQNFQFKQNKKDLDKLIKKNIRKNKNKQQEECIRKEIEEMRQKQKKIELTQRNQEVRQINASKINSRGGETLTNTVFFNLQKKNLDSCLETAQNKEVSVIQYNKRRSQSCIDGSNFAGKRKRNQSSSGEQKTHGSQGIKKSNDPYSKLKLKNETNLNTKENTQREILQNNKKQIPNTTTNIFINGKPRSFVDEIKILTQQIEKEISQESVRNAESGFKKKHQITTSAIGKGNKKINYVPQSAKNQKFNDDNIANLNLYSKKTEEDQNLKMNQQPSSKIQKKILEQINMEKGFDLKSRRASIELQRFIEKKKRIQQIQRELEQTIEVGKQIKIQNNLNKLQKFVQKNVKHMRQRSQPATLKHKMINERNSNMTQITGVTTKMLTQKRKQKKAKGTAPQTIMNMAEIFNYPQQQLHELSDDQIQDESKKYFTQKRKKSSNIAVRQNKAQTSNHNINKKQISNHQNIQSDIEIQLYKKPLNNDSSELIKNQVLYSDSFKNRISINEKHIQEGFIIPPHLHQKAKIINNNTQQLIDQNYYTSNQNSIADKIQYQNVNNQINQIQEQTVQQQQIQKPIRKEKEQNQKIIKQKQQKEEQLSPKSTEQIRRVHELVALYRCRFKQNASDAAVMGTLHSAASVIQIHFRYKKHLRQATQIKQLQVYKPKTKKHHQVIYEQQMNQSISSIYIQTDELRDTNKQNLSNRFNKVQNFQNIQFDNQIIDEDDRIIDNYSGFQMHTDYENKFPKQSDYIDTSEKTKQIEKYSEQSNSLKVLINSNSNEQKLQDILNEQEISQKDIIIEQPLIKKQNKRNDNRSNLEPKKEQKLDINSEENKNKRPQTVTQNTQNQVKKLQQQDIKSNQINIEYQNSSKGNRTPIVPELDFKKLKISSNIVQKQQNEQLDVIVQTNDIKESNANQQILVIDAGQLINNNLKTDIQNQQILQPDQQQTSSSYSGIFNRMGLPIPRSARVKVDYDLVQRDPKISQQLKEIVDLKNKKGLKAMDEGRKLNLITDRTYDINRKKLEKWVSSSYNRINDNQNEFSSSTRKHLQILQTKDELINAANDGRILLQNIMQNFNVEGDKLSSINAKPSGRSLGGRYSNRSWRGAQGQNFVQQNQLLNDASKSQRGEFYSENDPYGSHSGTLNQKIGSARAQKSKLVQMINNNSSRSNIYKQEENKKDYNSSQRTDEDLNDPTKLDDIEIHLNQGVQEDNNNGILLDINNAKKFLQMRDTREVQFDSNNVSEIILNKEGNHIKTEKSLNRSQSYPAISLNIGHQQSIINQNIEQLNDNSETSDQLNQQQQINNHFNKIEDQLENALQTEQQKQFENQSEGIQDYNEQFQKSIDDEKIRVLDSNKNIEKIRDPRFFMKQIDDDSNSKDNSQNKTSQKQEVRNNKNYQEDGIDDYSQINNFNDNNNTRESINANTTLIDSISKEKESPNKAIKVENQLIDLQMQNSNFKHDSSLFDSQLDNSQIKQNPEPSKSSQGYNIESIPDNTAPGHPVSPVSDSQFSQNQAFEFRITTGAHSLSSTDSDMTKGIRQANKEVLDSPPNVLSPTNPGFSQINQSLLRVVDEQQDQQQSEMNDISSIITEYLLIEILTELKQDMDVIIPRFNLQAHRQIPIIKFFEKKGIKTDLFAIEKYVDEILDEVKEDRLEFMAEINRSIGKNEIQQLYQMQNSEIGSFEHFQPQFPPVLALDLYLKLEKRRKDSRDPMIVKETGNPDGRFDFENVTDEDLLEDRVDKNFLAECQYIHNKILFDCINDSLQQFRPYGKDGLPMSWSKQGRKLKPTEDFTLEEMFEITKHDLFRMAIMQAGTLPRREFVFGGQFDEELFNELREKKLATLLCREIVETEHQWLKWDFEEAQTKIDLADMVLESLVTEVIEFLNKKKKENSSLHAQIQFEEIQQLIQSRI